MAVSKQQKMKCVVVGDRCTGKTCLLQTYTRGMFPEGYLPTVFDDFETTNEDVDGVSVTLSLFDTSGMEDFDRLRPLYYPQTRSASSCCSPVLPNIGGLNNVSEDVFLIVFSVVYPSTFENIRERWSPEIIHHMPHTPVILVGNMADPDKNDPDILSNLRSRKREPIKMEEAEEMREKIGASAYVECSAETMEGVDDVFNEAIRAVWKANEQGEKTSKKSKKSTGCQIA